MDTLTALQEWFALVCDGDWEHSYGIKIDTLDNPGWAVDIDLIGTPLENAQFEQVDIDRTENDWIRCWVENGIFKGCGGVRNLSEILCLFAEWQTKHIIC